MFFLVVLFFQMKAPEQEQLVQEETAVHPSLTAQVR